MKNWQFISPDHSAVIADSWNKRRWVRENFEYYSELELLTWVKCPWLSCLIMEMSVVKGALNKSLTWSSWKPVAEKVITLWRSCSIYTCLHRVLCQFACAIQNVHLDHLSVCIFLQNTYTTLWNFQVLCRLHAWLMDLMINIIIMSQYCTIIS